LYNYTREMSRVKLAEKIKKHREKIGLTQEALARKADISYNTIIKLETGGIKDPRISTLSKVAKALGVTVDALITED